MSPSRSPSRRGWLVWMLVLALTVALSSLPHASAYAVWIPVAMTSGTVPVQNVDCILAVRCASLPAGIDHEADDPMAIADLDIDHAPTVYVGRAAGRCQRKLNEIKCAISSLLSSQSEPPAPSDCPPHLTYFHCA